MDEAIEDTEVRARLRAALTVAMKRRDRVAVGALRSAIGSIDNAEAVDVAAATAPTEGPIAGAVSGLRATEVARRALTTADVIAVLQGEIDERETAASEYARLGRPDEAATLRAEAAVLTAQLHG